MEINLLLVGVLLAIVLFINQGLMLGGLGLLLKAQLNVKTKLCNSFQSFEYLDSTLVGVKSVRMIIVYRLPSSAVNGPELLTSFQLSF